MLLIAFTAFSVHVARRSGHGRLGCRHPEIA
jgi:hypothetical protein